MHERYYYVIATPVFSENQITGSVVIALDRPSASSARCGAEFSANVSHELKNAAHVDLRVCGASRQRHGSAGAGGQFAGDIYKESQRLMALVDDIIELSVSKKETTAPETEALIFPLAEKRSPLSARRRSGGT